MPFDPLGMAGPSPNELPPSKPRTGFASQPGEHEEIPLNIHDVVVKHPHAVFYFRASGPSAETVQILSNDILVVDRVEPFTNGALVVVVDADEFIVRWLKRVDGRWLLVADTEGSVPIPLEDSTLLFGVVTHVIHTVPHRTWETTP